jgi:GAF domain-containing protein
MSQRTADAPAAALAELARIVLRDEDLDSVLLRAAQVAERAIPGVEEVSVTLVSAEGEASSPAFTGELALAADEMQYERGYGPCLDAGRGGVVLLVADMRTEQRWPDYAANVLEVGIRSSLSVPLPVQDEVIGALNCYSTRAHSFTDASVDVASQVAAFVAVAVTNATAYTDAVVLAEQMRQAMATRAVIEQAKGALIAQHGCSANDAFDMLVRASQRSQRKLRDVAAAMVAGIQRS